MVRSFHVGVAGALFTAGFLVHAAVAEDPRPTAPQSYVPAAPSVAESAFLAPVEEPDEATIRRNRLLERMRRSKFWIGVSCEPADEALRSQLGIEHGLVVENVVDDSPAEKAGLGEHDILLRFGKAELKEVEQLMDLVDEQGEKEVEVVILRSGKERMLQLLPTKRAIDATADVEVVEQDLADHLNRLRQHPHVMNMTIVRPGVALPPGHVRKLELPEGVSVTIRKEGDKPARITVKRGEKEWNVSEDALDELPEELRHHVEQMRGQTIDFRLEGVPGAEMHRKAIRLYSEPQFKAAVPGARMIVKPLPPSVASSAVPYLPIAPSQDSKQFDEINKKLDQVLKAVQVSSDVQKLHQEVERLRSDVDLLRKQLDERK